MRKFLTIIMISTFLISSVYGQERDSISELSLTIISQVNQGNSFITFPTDIGNIEPLWFEGNIIPNFYLRHSKNSRLMGVLTPQIIIRMYQEESFPVRTPSYMPQVTVYYLLSEKERSQTTSLFGRIGHHSNGQEGDFYLENGEINLKSGNFATNFFELGFIATNINTRYNAYQFFKTSIEIHPKELVQDELIGIYSRYRWHSAFSIFKLSAKDNQDKVKRPAISIKGETTWMFGDYNDLATISSERLNLSLTFYYHPKFLEDIGLFVQYYHGSDYYNMYFGHRIDVLRFGIMTEKLRF
ncbi:MAG: hypothetical protein PF484_06820 [Bacteroidales bacterium]|jgi:hypothetical protein|nr:hypothetical protein [Bacteroidales bacterium]